jgi:O-antigen/teichoic acid export membrane protein
LCLATSQWGSSYTIYNSSVKNKYRGIFLILSSVSYRVLIYLLMTTIILSWLFYSEKYTVDNTIFIGLVIISNIFLGLDVYQYFFNARLKSKVNAMSTMKAKAISMAMRVAFVLYGLDLWFFIIPLLIEGAICWYLKHDFVKKEIGKKRVYHFKSCKIRYNNRFIKSGRALVITAICVYIYTKSNELLLVELLDYTKLGYYSVSLAISSAWVFIPQSIGISMLSKPMMMINIIDRTKSFSFVFLCMIVISIPILIFVYYFKDFILGVTFGQQYVKASDILFIMCLASLCSSLNFINNRIISTLKDGNRFLLIKSIFSTILSILFSYFLISKFGILGASLSWLIIELLNFTIFNYFFSSSYIFKIHIGILNISSYKNYRSNCLEG